MELTVTTIVAFTTLVLGEITKRLGWVDKKYIPIQTLVVGLTSGAICFFCGVEENFFTAIVSCVLASAAASGVYDVVTVKKDAVGLIEEEDK